MTLFISNYIHHENYLTQTLSIDFQFKYIKPISFDNTFQYGIQKLSML